MISAEILNSIKTFKPMYFKQAFPILFTWKDLEWLLNLRPFVAAARTHILNGGQYSWKNQAWLSDINTFPPTILEQEIRKYISYLSDASRVNAEINEVCKDLEEAFSDKNLAVDAHIYFDVCDKTDDGFGIHWDYVNVFIVQSQGTTNMKIWGDEIDPDTHIRNVKRIKKEPIIDVVMEPGDAVLVPMYHYHQAKSLTDRLSVSFPMEFNATPQDRNWIKLSI